ncbi:MAG: imelysin family protein, partial [Verrucomicrobiota bacterium]
MKALFLSAILALGPTFAFADLKPKVVSTHAAIVHRTYSNALAAAKSYQLAVDAFLASPSEDTLAAAKKAWVDSRPPYLLTETYRFCEGPIDDEDGPEALMNAWPMDETYIDTIIEDSATYPELSAELLISLNEKEGETNISTGFHAAEYLLWGADTFADSPGKRPATDFTDGEHGDRRKQYLKVVTDLLIQHLEQMVSEWAPEQSDNYRAWFEENPTDAMERILTGMAMMSAFELAGERLYVALETQDQEDEHSCFSDTTDQDCIYDALGIVNIWKGSYDTIDGHGLDDLATELDPELAGELDA